MAGGGAPVWGPARAPGAPGAPTIVTPEAVPLEFETAGIGSRGLAYSIDLVIMLSLLFALVMAVGALGAAAGGLLPAWLGVSLLLLAIFGVQFGYPIGFETLWHGRTPGKAVLGLRVVTKEGGPIRLRHAAIRAALGVVDFLLTLGSAALLSALFTRENQRLGDLAAGTVVLRERTGRTLPVAVRFSPPPGLEGYVAALDVGGLGPQEYAAARSFLMRAPTLPAATRDRLARELARAVSTGIRAPAVGAPIGAETFLACVAAAYQARHASVPGAGGTAPAYQAGHVSVAAAWGTAPADEAGHARVPGAGGSAPAGHGSLPDPPPSPPHPARPAPTGFVPPS